MPIYRPSEAVQTIILARPINTVTTLEIRGSEDNFATDRREFSTEEEVRINGSVTATDGANLSTTQVEIYLDKILQARASLTYDPVTRANLYVYSLGLIPEGTHEIRVYFPRFRTYSASAAQAIVAVPLLWEKIKVWWASLPWWQKALVIAGVTTAAVGSGYLIAKKLKK